MCQKNKIHCSTAHRAFARCIVVDTLTTNVTNEVKPNDDGNENQVYYKRARKKRSEGALDQAAHPHM